MRKQLFFIPLLSLFLFSCKKENPRPQWDIEVLGPLLHASLGIDELDGDSTIIADANGAQIVNFDKELSLFDLDTISQVPDTSIRTVTTFPNIPNPNPIPPNTPFVSNNNNIELALNNVLLKKAIIGSGRIRLEIKNTLKTKVFFTYTIPKALKNNLPFTATAEVDSGSTTDPKYFSQEFDFTGYELDLTGISGNLYNSISYNVRAVSDPDGVPFIINGNDTILNLTTTLVELSPSYAKGYLGEQENNDVTSTDVRFSKIVKSGLLHLDSIKMNLDLSNSIGADANLFLNNLKSVNSRTGNTVNLVAPSVIQHSININRATETFDVNNPVIPTAYPIQLDHNNSNIVSFVENLPDSVSYDFRIKINPLGNVSGSNDFIYSDRLLNTRLRVLMPLRFAMNQLVLADTVPFEIDNAADFDPVGSATLTLIANNGFPIDLNVQMFLLDASNNITDSLFVPDLISAAPVDANYKATGKTTSVIKIPIDADRKKRLQEVTRVGIRIRFNTPDYPQLIQMYSDYRVDLKMIADGIYMLR